MQAEAVLAFWALSALFVVTPGADWAYAISAGLAGRRWVAPAVGGLLLGHLAATVVVAAGVGALLAEVPFALTVLTVGGAAYLVWLGVGTLRMSAGRVAASGDRHDSWRTWTLKGAGVSGLNPKLFLLFLALLPQFTDPSGAFPVWSQITVLGLIHTASCAVVYLVVGFGAHAVLGARPRAARVVTVVSGVVMIGIGGFLVVEQLIHTIHPPVA